MKRIITKLTNLIINFTIFSGHMIIICSLHCYLFRHIWILNIIIIIRGVLQWPWFVIFPCQDHFLQTRYQFLPPMLSTLSVIFESWLLLFLSVLYYNDPWIVKLNQHFPKTRILDIMHPQGRSSNVINIPK